MITPSRSIQSIYFQIRTHPHVYNIRLLVAKLAVLGLLLLVGNSCSSGLSGQDEIPPAPAPPASSSYDDGTIKVGDSLELFVKEDPVFNNTYKVREGGDIIIPDIGRIPLKGLSVASAERRVESYLEKGQIKDATVILDRVRSVAPASSVAGSRQMLVYMTGAVSKPGQHVLAVPEGRSLGIYEAILISGGLAQFADEQKVHVLRMDSKRIRHRIPVNIRMIRQGGAPDPVIGQGDVVVVPEKVFGF